MKAAQLIWNSRLLHRKPYVSSPEKGYDYIVIGSGSAGSVIASRLAQKNIGSVLLVESGPKESFPPWNINMPSALGFNLQTTQVNWHYETVSQKNLNNRRLYHPRGKTIGGSSSINGMVFIRGHSMDFDNWAKDIKSDSWNYASCLPYFKKSESTTFGEDRFRGRDGPIRLSRQDVSYSEELIQAYLKACESSGHKFTDDFNGITQEGYGWYDRSIYQGIRQSTRQYIDMVARSENCGNLSVLTGYLASKIQFNSTRTNAVQLLQELPYKSKTPLKINVRKEVIVCAGAFNSPKLLMLSGIGNTHTLQKFGIPTLVNLSGVGQNLQDHLEVYVQHLCKKPITLYGVTSSLFQQAKSFLQWQLNGSGVLSTAHLDVGVFLRSSPSMSHPDVQIHFLPFAVMDHGRVEPTTHMFQVHVGTLRAQSKGYVSLINLDPRAAPYIDPQYLSVPQDLIDLRESVKIARKIFSDSAMDDFRGNEILPGSQYGGSDEKIDEFLRQHVETAYHPCGTCKMGPEDDSMSVLSPEMKVYGVKGLRVVDASAMPSITSGNLNSVVIMMAEKAADMIN